ncbi:hypothetical protein Pjdr2_6036 [Paenibacillus sp. JDR-2]|nr:hypothetical protein Pjdr2_6036 [Paenibacillus sp. JDR-2]
MEDPPEELVEPEEDELLAGVFTAGVLGCDSSCFTNVTFLPESSDLLAAGAEASGLLAAGVVWAGFAAGAGVAAGAAEVVDGLEDAAGSEALVVAGFEAADVDVEAGVEAFWTASVELALAVFASAFVSSAGAAAVCAD